MKKALVMALVIWGLFMVLSVQAFAAEEVYVVANGKAVETETVAEHTKDVSESVKNRFNSTGWTVELKAFASVDIDWTNKVVTAGHINEVATGLERWDKMATSEEYKGLDEVVITGNKSSKVEAERVTMVGPAAEEASYRETLSRIPEEILKKFNDMGWRVVYGEKALVGVDVTGGDVIGTTVYADKTIYTTKANTLVHEFGHFVDTVMNGKTGTSACESLRASEGAKANGTLTRYECNSDNEYFAGYFRAYINSIGNTSKLGTLSNKTPETFKFFSDMANNGWVIAK